MFLRKSLVAVLILFAFFHLYHVFRPIPLGRFALVYVYEANTHTGANARPEPLQSPAMPGTHVANGMLYVKEGKKPNPFTGVSLLTETNEAGQTKAAFTQNSTLPLAMCTIGHSKSPHRLLSGTLCVRLVDMAGTVELRYSGFVHRLPAGQSWSVATCEKDELRGVYERGTPAYEGVLDASLQGEMASRLLVYNHGLWDTKNVCVPDL